MNFGSYHSKHTSSKQSLSLCLDCMPSIFQCTTDFLYGFCVLFMRLVRKKKKKHIFYFKTEFHSIILAYNYFVTVFFCFYRRLIISLRPNQEVSEICGHTNTALSLSLTGRVFHGLSFRFFSYGTPFPPW